MVRWRYLYIALIIGLSLIACQKEELPINPSDRGEQLLAQVLMGDNYQNQIYYNLLQQEVISSNFKTDWDLAFESSEDGWHILLNPAKLESVHRSDQEFEDLLEIPEDNWMYDDITGDLDATAIGNWQLFSGTYVLDRGYDIEGNHIGYKKLIIDSYNEFSYSLRYANLNGSSEESLIIEKNPATSFTQFSFETNSVAAIEPPRESWDILFTHYTEIFEGGELPYLVSGAIINRNGFEVAELEEIEFGEITQSDVEALEFTGAINAIGYDWKEYNFDTGLYEVFPYKNYIIKRPDGRYFKLHFIDFYSDTGEKGAPMFEFQEL